MIKFESHEDFIPQEQALALKLLKFDEPCLAKWMIDIKGETIPHFRYNYAKEGLWFQHNTKDISSLNGYGGKDFLWSAPMYYQAFEFFRQKFKMNSYVEDVFGLGTLCYVYVIEGDIDSKSAINQNPTDTHKECQLECLKKLIEFAIRKLRIKVKPSIPERPKYEHYCGGVLDTCSIREAESMIDDQRDNYKRAMQRWWEKLTHNQQKEEWKKDSQLVFYVDKPKSKKK